jgi:hypothetical protein
MNHAEAIKMVLEREKEQKMTWIPYVENKKPSPLKYGKGSYWLTLEESNGYRHVCEASYCDYDGWHRQSYDGPSIHLPEHDEKIVAYMIHYIPSPYAG